MKLSKFLLAAAVGFLMACNNDNPAPEEPLSITGIQPDSGKKNVQVTISGNGFSEIPSENTVAFNGILAEVTVASKTGLAVIVPKGAGSGPITLKVKEKEITGPQFNFIYTATTSLVAGSSIGFEEGTGDQAKFYWSAAKAVHTIRGAGESSSGTFSNPSGEGMYASGGGVIIHIDDEGTTKFIAGEVNDYGLVDGKASAARFHNSASGGLALDDQGNIYVADYSNHAIRKITSTGVVITLAGNGDAGYQNGSSSTALFYSPTGLAVGKDGSIYVADRYNNCIRKINPDGETVTTLAGSATGESGFQDGTGVLARFYRPSSIISDGNDNLYVTDQFNHRIRKIVGNEVTTIAGSGTEGFLDGPAVSAKFGFPTDLAISSTGEIYVADADNNRIRKIATDGMVTTISGNGNYGYVEGVDLEAEYRNPAGIFIKGDTTLFVVDAFNQKIRKIVLD